MPAPLATSACAEDSGSVLAAPMFWVATVSCAAPVTLDAGNICGTKTADHTSTATMTADNPHHARRITAAAPSSTSSSTVHGRKLVQAAPAPFADGTDDAKPIPAATTSAAKAIPNPRSERRRRGIGGSVRGADGGWVNPVHGPGAGGSAEIRGRGIVCGFTVRGRAGPGRVARIGGIHPAADGPRR